jgi:hypothetical protein
LATITIPDRVTFIGQNAFALCSNLIRVTFQSVTPPTLQGTLPFENTPSTMRIFVPEGKAEDYRTTWNIPALRNRIHSVGCELPNPATGVNCSCE